MPFVVSLKESIYRMARDDTIELDNRFFPWQRGNEIIDFDVAFYGFEQVSFPIFYDHNLLIIFQNNQFIDYFLKAGNWWFGEFLITDYIKIYKLLMIDD
jgi:hypothetical protein